jgi:hypothetical protein
MRFSRHAKNRMRLCGVSGAEVLGIISSDNRAGEDPAGNLLYVGKIRGLSICAVLALDDLTTVITVYDLEHDAS